MNEKAIKNYVERKLLNIPHPVLARRDFIRDIGLSNDEISRMTGIPIGDVESMRNPNMKSLTFLDNLSGERLEFFKQYLVSRGYYTV